MSDCARVSSVLLPANVLTRSLTSSARFITTDIARFCETLSALYGNIAKPVLDIVIFTAQLSSSLGPMGTVGLFGSVLRRTSRSESARTIDD